MTMNMKSQFSHRKMLVILISMVLVLSLFAGCGGGGEGEGGYWYDSSSGLTWQNPPPENTMTWQDAIDYCSALPLDGGGWHLPTISELRSLIRGCPGTVSGGACGVTDACLSGGCQNGSCDGCALDEGPANGCYRPDGMNGSCGVYWSSSPVEDIGGYALYVYFYSGGVPFYLNAIDLNDVSHGSYVRCVR